MRRGEVVWVDLDPTRGSEASKRRPAVVVSNDGANRTAQSLGRGVVTVVPITSHTSKVYPFQVLLPAKSCGLPKASKAQAEQIRSVPLQRIGTVAGRLPSDLLAEVDDAIDCTSPFEPDRPLFGATSAVERTEEPASGPPEFRSTAPRRSLPGLAHADEDARARGPAQCGAARNMTGGELDYADVHGLRIAFRRAGAGPPLLLLHGGLCDSRVWRVQLEELSDEFAVVAWDAPGCGASSDPPEMYRLPEYADCLAAFIHAVGLVQPHAVGHSFGGGLAARRPAPRHPEVAVLAGGTGLGRSLPPDEVEARLQLALRIAELPSAASPSPFRASFRTPWPPIWRRSFKVIMSEIRPVGTRVMACSFAEADLRPARPASWFRRCFCTATPMNVLRRMLPRRSMPASRPSTLVMLPGLGHESYLESPETFNAEVRRFLRYLSLSVQPRWPKRPPPSGA